MIFILYGLLHLPPVQTWLVQTTTRQLSKKLNAEISIHKVDVRFFNKLSLEKLLVRDRSKDTLLYAGSLTLNVNDWFFFSDKLNLKYLKLDDACIYLNRKDTVWNYEFIIDHFADTSKSGGGGGGFKLGLQKIQLSNIRFLQRDQWVGQDMTVGIGSMDLNIENFDADKKKIDVTELRISKPSFWQFEYPGNKPKGYKSGAAKTPETPPSYQWNNDEWDIRLALMQMLDGSIRIDKESDYAPYTDRFDGEHLFFTGIDGNIRDLSFTKDTLKLELALKGKEKSGLQLRQMTATVRFTPEIMEFRNLDLRTNRSRLGHYYAMQYKDFIDDMNSYISNVEMKGDFSESEIHSDDLALFDPAIGKLNRIFSISGNASGTVEDLKGKNMSIKSGSSILEGDFTLKGLPDTDESILSLDAKDLRTDITEVMSLAPGLRHIKGINWNSIGKITYRGHFEGKIHDFKATGDIETGIGNMIVDIAMNIPQRSLAKYDGTLTTQSIDLGRLLNNNDLGIISFGGKVSGKGFNIDELSAYFDGDIQRLHFNGYDYRNLTVNGLFEKSVFNGNLRIDDPNLKISKLQGMLNLSRKDINLDLSATLEHLDFAPLNLINRDLQLSGNFDLKFTGNNIDNFLGYARISKARLTSDGRLLSFDSLALSSSMKENEKHLSLYSNEAEAEISGRFAILELPTAFQAFLHRYYPGYIAAPEKEIGDQQFSFSVRTRDIEPFIKLINSDLGGMDRATVAGKLDFSGKNLEVSANVPSFIYKGRQFSKIKIRGSGNSDSLLTDISVEDIAITDSLHLPGTQLKLISSNDISKVNLNTSASEALTNAELNAEIRTSPDSVAFYFSPSSFILNNKKWDLDKDGALTIGKKTLEARNIRITEGNQELTLSSSGDKSKSILTAGMKNLTIEELVPFIFTDPELKGRLTGIVQVTDPLGDALINFKGKSEDLYFNDTYLGNVELSSKADTKTGVIEFSGVSDSKEAHFNIAGFYNSMDSTGNNLKIGMTGDRINLKFIEPYLAGVFSSVEGMARSNLQLFNEKGKSFLTGFIDVDTAMVEVEYTKCRYRFRNESILFNKNEIDLGSIRLLDTFKNEGSVSGKIRHKFFSDFSFSNIRFETAKMQLLNTTRNDNDQFYGYVTGNAVMTLNGPVSNMRMTIDGQPSMLDSSRIFISTGDSRESNTIDYIEFEQLGTQTVADVWQNESTDIIVDMNIIANPSCKVDVILDEKTGDVIRGSGKGQISLKVGNREPLSVRGRYELTEGEYTFNFQTFLKKPFDLKRGTLTWNGDPYEAIIDIDAEYIAKNVNISNIVPSGGFKQKEDIIIISHLKGNLSNPAISFEFKVPEKSELNRDIITLKRLTDIQKDETEMNKQVASLLLFNTFITESQTFFSGGNTMALMTSTVGGIISEWLTNMFNRELERATRGLVSTYIDINPSLSLEKNANELQANVRAGLKLLLSNRLVFLVGGNLEYNNPYVIQYQRKGLLTPDLTLEWLLNKEGSVRVVGFHRSSIDYSLGLRNRSGAQLSFRKDFDKPGDLFRSRKRIEENAIKEEGKSN